MHTLRWTGLSVTAAVLVAVAGIGAAIGLAVMVGLPVPLPVALPSEFPNLLAPFMSQNDGAGRTCVWVLSQGGCW